MFRDFAKMTLTKLSMILVHRMFLPPTEGYTIALNALQVLFRSRAQSAGAKSDVKNHYHDPEMGPDQDNRS